MADFYDGRLRSGDYDYGRRSSGPRKGFDKYKTIGMLMLFFGMAIIVLGVFLFGWTLSRYGDNCKADSAGVYLGLCFGNHIYVYVGSPLWAGALLVVAAHVALTIHPDKAQSRSKNTFFIYFLVLHMLVVLPATVVLNVLEVVFGKGVFWIFDKNGKIQAYDQVQFGLPIAIAALTAMVINAILFFLVVVVCCTSDSPYKTPRYYDGPEGDDGYRGQGYRYPPRDPYRYGPAGYPRYGGGYGGRRSYYN